MIDTLETLKADYEKLGERLSAFQAKADFAAAFPIEVLAPELRAGEKWVATLIADDGKSRYHLILLPGDASKASWKDQMAWAKKQGGDLPDRVEQALLFKHCRSDFEQVAYWSNTEHESESGFAWFQFFSYGLQLNDRKNVELRARAVRRLPI